MDVLGLTKVIGFGLTAFGQFQANKAQADIASFNAGQASREADMTRQATEFNVDRIRRQAEVYRSEQIAGYAKAGVRLTGTPVEVLASTAAEFEMDAIAERYKGQTNIYRSEMDAEQNMTRSRFYKSAGLLEPALTLLKSTPDVYDFGRSLRKKNTNG